MENAKKDEKNKTEFFDKLTVTLSIVAVVAIALVGMFLLTMEAPESATIIKKDADVSFSSERAESKSTMININTAPKEELVLISGIGTTKAENIIAYRENKPFTKIEDIMNVEGIGQKLFDKIKDRICVE